VRSAVRYCTATGVADGPDSCSTNAALALPVSPSTTASSNTVRVGVGRPRSSSTIVPTPRGRAIAAPSGLDRLNDSVSSSSGRRSPTTGTITSALVWPGSNLTMLANGL